MEEVFFLMPHLIQFKPEKQYVQRYYWTLLSYKNDTEINLSFGF